MNIDKSRRLQQEVIAKVLQVVAFPQPASQMVSIKYVIPARAPIELWDGGVPVTLEQGQTVQSLANIYGVPSWAISQASGISQDDDASPGRRLIVPRHLNTLAPTGPTPPHFGSSPFGQSDATFSSR
jgi:hypothetical protein